MTVGWFVHFFGLAFVYAAIATVLILGLARLWRGPVAWRAVPLVLATAFFVFLTQHPFPDPGQMECPVPSAAPQLRLFDYRDTVLLLLDRGAGVMGWLGNKMIAATAMNFVICAAIGTALAMHATRVRTAVLFGAALTLSVELSQLTGVWGIFPCAYRQFNVDDLVLNVLGVVTGFAVARRVRIGTQRFWAA